MTLIAGFMKNGVPILMGDLLISSDGESNHEVVIPTLLKISSPQIKTGKLRPSGLSQKVNQLSPKLAIAWSGNNMLSARMFMGEIISAGLHNEPSRDALFDIFNNDDYKELSIIGLFRDGRNATLFEFNSLPVDAPDSSYTWFRAGGTGYDRLLDFLPKLHFVSKSGQINQLEQGLFSAIRIVSSLLSLEIKTSLSLDDVFGAGYEIIHPLGDGLAKLGDITYNFWKADEYAPGKWALSAPFLVMKYSYHNDILIIRCVRPSLNPDTKSLLVDNDELHIIEPIYRMINGGELDGYVPPSLNSKMTCNIFLCTNINGVFETFNSFGRNINQSAPIVFKNEFQENQAVDINVEFLEASMRKIVSRFNPDS